MDPPFRRRPGPGGGKKMAFWAILAALATAQPASQDDSRSASLSRDAPLLRPATPLPAGGSPAENPGAALKLESTYAKHRNTHTSENDGFMSALAPARLDEVVRAPLLREGQSSSGLSSLPSARSLQDWEAEDFLLVATIDGSLHALDRRNGKEIWALGNPESPMVETIHHRHNKSNDIGEEPEDDFIFIVEPSLDGHLYMQHRDPAIGLQRLDMTVRSLVDRSPQRTREPPLVFVARKEASMYTIDAATGNIKDFIDTTATYVNSDDTTTGNCRKLSGFELDEDCQPAGVLHIGRTTYSVVIQDGHTREKICTIKYSEWAPNNGDQDLHTQYINPFDSRRIHSFHDGQFIGLDVGGLNPRTKFHGKLDTPVARVWDVARPMGHLSSDSALLMLSPPTDPASLSKVGWNDEFNQDKVFVNRTEAGWFAMSELRYPGITSHAKRAKVHFLDGSEQGSLDLTVDSENLVGYHDLNSVGRVFTPLTISAPPIAEVALPVPLEVATLPSNTPAAALAHAATQYSAGAILLAVILAFAFNKKWGIPDFRMYQQKKLDISLLAEKPLPQLPRSRSNSIGVEVVAHKRTGSNQPSQPSSSSQGRRGSLPSSSSQEQLNGTVTPKVRSRQNSEAQDSISDSESDEEGDKGSHPAARKKTKRGKRGARKSKKVSKTMNPDSVEDLMIVPERLQKDGEMLVGRLRIDTKTCLGNGSAGTVVFPGQFDGREVAVKRIVRSTYSLAAKEIKHLLSSDENPHVIRYIGKEETANFTYIALDRFTASLDQVVERPERYPTLVQAPQGIDIKDALRQVTDGVQHLHSLKLVHRDIKPQNVLVRAVKSQRPTAGPPKLQFVISDFGLCKTLDDGPNSTYAPTANHTAAGTSGWRAPELLTSSSKPTFHLPNSSSLTSSLTSSDGTSIDPPTGRRATKAIDIFSLGCVFFYMMTQGRHPFDVGGESLGRDLNIKENRSDLQVLRLYDYTYEADDLIMQMLSHEPHNRPDTATILTHPYFWSVDTKLEFLCELSDRFELEKTQLDPPSLILTALESQASNVIGPSRDFLKALPRGFLTEMGRQRKYTGSRMLDLLRVIRNKKNHFGDLPEHIREMMGGGTAEGYFGFWGKRFPSLLVVCHALVLEEGLVEGWRLERYF